MGQDKVNLCPYLSINGVLHVTNLATNLISIHQLTKDLHCNAIFSPHMCKFQVRDTGKMIGVAKEQHRLYVLQGESTCPQMRQLRIVCSSQSASDLSNIWLHHFRLGHPPFILLKSMFLALFKTVTTLLWLLQPFHNSEGIDREI